MTVNAYQTTTTGSRLGSHQRDSQYLAEEAFTAAFRGNVAALERCLAAGADINSLYVTKNWPRGVSLLEAALRGVSPRSFAWLIENGAKAHLVKIAEEPLLVAAIEMQHVENCRVLLKDRASLRGMRDSCGGSLIDVARAGNYNEAGRKIEQMVREAIRESREKSDRYEESSDRLVKTRKLTGKGH